MILCLFATFAERMFHASFPLFSKGVDTYRFEYGVFLLNKDIELVSAKSVGCSIHCLRVVFAHG